MRRMLLGLVALAGAAACSNANGPQSTPPRAALNIVRQDSTYKPLLSTQGQFYAKAGQVIDLPERRADRPGREFLEWHLDEVFLKAATT